MATTEATLPKLSNGLNGHIEEIAAVELTGAEIVCKALEAEGVDIVFGYPGGAVIPLYDALPRAGFHHVLTRFEQWAALAADGYARATGKVGVCMATSGPGATNLVTGLANAQLDSVPVVAITGQVVQPLIGKDAFQECDITGITLPVTKHNYLVTRIQDIAPTIKEAFYLAKSGRPGPVLVDIPKSLFVSRMIYKPGKLRDRRGYQPTTSPNMRQVKLAAEAMNKAEKPIFMAGHGILLSGAEESFAALVEKTGIPVAFTLLGQGSYPESQPLALGLMGMHGHREVNKALDEADLLVNIGARFDDRATGKVSGFAPNAKIVHVDIDPAEIGKNVETKVPVVGDAKEVLDLLVDLVDERRHDEWISWIESQRNFVLEAALEDRPETPEPYTIIKAIAEATRGKAIYATDVGQHQMWAAQHLGLDHPNNWLTSGGLGTMGYGLPAAVGAKIGCPDKEVWAICGDGGFQMSLNELATCVQEGIDVKIAVLNNGYLGMVRQWQDLFHGKNYSEVKINGPDFVKLAEAYGVTGIRVETDAELLPAIQRARETPGTVVVEFIIEPEANVWPIVPQGASNSEMLHQYEDK
ncbi:MAG: biosynthetic-type acetolactate synthase large subunit [Thermomicrobiales bacterium]|nr:biosynthetic-type acetolactate synthase large subunit [Thermomicrobiales bacterium]MCO5223631.1 biosynthetic-type acetolactate synthase large subunit [Thermomicrobiales bacterium]